MKKAVKLILLITLYSILFTQYSLAQSLSGQALIDSLEAELPKAKGDSNHVKLLNKLSGKYRDFNPDKGIYYGEKAVELAKKISWEKELATSYNSLGLNYISQSNYPKALEFLKKALKINKELNIKSSISMNQLNIGIIFKDQSDYPNALNYYLKALKIAEEIGSNSLKLKALGNIGTVYKEQFNNPKALEYYEKALKIAKEIGNKSFIALVIGNIGNIYLAQSDYPKALEYYEKALKINEELGNKYGQAIIFGSIGIIYYYETDYRKALEYYEKALKIAEEIGNKSMIALATGNIGDLYLKISQDSLKISPNELNNHISINKALNLNNAVNYLNESIQLSIEIGEYSIRINSLKNLAKTYKLKGDFKKALEASDLHHKLKDSIYNQENQKKLDALTKEREEREAEKEAQLLAEKIAYRNSLQYLGLGAIVILFAVLLLLQGRMKFNELFARALVFITFILTFEFIFVMIDPFTDDYSEGEPVIKFAINLALALIIFPMHQFFERRVTKTLLSRGYGSSIEKVLEEFKKKKES